jgi:hypothetical protein
MKIRIHDELPANDPLYEYYNRGLYFIPKTARLEELARERGLEVVTIVAPPAEPEDYAGLPCVLDHAPPPWVDFLVNHNIDKE